MHLPQCILTMSTIASLVISAPFIPQNGKLQSQRRRLVDYPILSAEMAVPENGLRKRSVRRRDVPYSVVPVNGAEATTTAAITVTETVAPTTKTTVPIVTPTPSVETIVYTSIVTKKGPNETILVTTTNTLPAPTVAPEVSIVTVVATPSPTSTTYYDDGLWHTYYPVKSWVTSTTTATATPVFLLEVRNVKNKKP